MKKIILSFVFVMMSILSYSQIDFNGFCDCCSYPESHLKDNTYIIVHKKDTLILANYFFIGNDIKQNEYNFLHYTLYHNNKNYNLELIDSLKDSKIIPLINYLNYEEIKKIGKTFKYGYIDKYSWSTNSVNGINFNISYTNTNSKTIKYIDIYFIIKNPVGDTIKQYNNGYWSWNAVYYTTGDASNLHFTKFVITYMDNTKYTLVKELAYKYYILDN